MSHAPLLGIKVFPSNKFCDLAAVCFKPDSAHVAFARRQKGGVR
jgi:hypothetical protein